MTSSFAGTIAVWTFALWALGWLVLPVSRRIFVGLPDGGLAAGRVLFLVIGALGAFWGAAAHLVPLGMSSLFISGAALGAAVLYWNADARQWARANWRALALSDAIFLLGWAGFLWVRLQHPELNDLEKPMDAALLSAAWKADWLPFAHPWFAGETFTNYYYFGPLMGALMGRALGAPPHLAYNLVQPAFCAFFLSTAWALGAALTRSKAWGIAVMVLVGLSGPLEPLRQWSERGWNWPFDWWTTSRVIPNTINEYPAFTMAIGDAHAHFYALSLAALWLCLAWSLFSQAPDRTVWRGKMILLSGLVLGAWLMTNTWDAPIYGLLFGVALYFSRPAKESFKGQLWLSIGALFVGAVMASALYFWKFQSPVGGAQFDPWWPDTLSLALLWGGWLALGALALLLPAAPNDEGARFRRLLVGAGVLALLAPFVFYIQGAFAGELRHQDTVFKFGLQAWVVLGIGISAELGARVLALSKTPRLIVALLLILVAPVLALAPATTLWTRAISQGTAQNAGKSLDGMRYLPLAEQRAIVWLQRNGRAGEIAMEGVPIQENGWPGGDYDGNWGRVGAFSGLSSTLGWPQHVWGWDANAEAVLKRGQKIAALYALPSTLQTARGASELGARYVFFGRGEGNWQTPDEAQARAEGFEAHLFEGEDGSRALILERIGR